jgi:hypothetical protein
MPEASCPAEKMAESHVHAAQDPQPEPQPLQQRASSHTLVEDHVAAPPRIEVTYRRRGKRWVAVRPKGSIYRNNLMLAIGFLDLTNGLDFPANVWNNIPIPVFAQVLMALGGSIAIFWTVFAVWDFMRSRRNIHFLQAERIALKERREKVSHRRLEQWRLVQAWLHVNFRELGWEWIDRAVMDAMLGFAGILVGIGTIIAMKGANPVIFHVSNLLSGYVGNSFVAAYGVLNAAWSVFMWQRAQRHTRAIYDPKIGVDPDLRKRMRALTWKHKLYAILNGVTVLASAVGSLISATMWPGYVVIAPCVISSVFCNVYWRQKVGYNRLHFDQWVGNGEIDIYRKLQRLNAMLQLLPRRTPKTSARLEDFIRSVKPLKKTDILHFIEEFCLFDEFGASLLEKKNLASGDTKTLRMTDALELEDRIVAEAAIDCLRRKGRRCFRDQERFLLELYGGYLASLEDQSEKASNDIAEEKVSNTSNT